MLQAFLCLFVLVGVVGILHTTVLGSQSESIVGDVNMWMPLVAATAITALVAGLTMRHPDPTAVYKGCLPAMLAILSLLPFFGEALGGLAGLVMITCYDVCGMVFLLFIVDRARTLRMSSYVLSSVYLGGSGLFLVIGLSIGGVLGALSRVAGDDLAGGGEDLAGVGVFHILRQRHARHAAREGKLLIVLVAAHMRQIVALGVEQKGV